MDLFRTLIGPDDGYQSMAQLSVRAALVLIFGVVCVRIAGRRTFSQAAPLDIIVYLIVGSNLSRVITGKANVFPTLAATLTLVILHRALAMLTLSDNPVSRLFKSHSTVLVRDGIPGRKAMWRVGISEPDLHQALRLQQVERIEQVRLATLERGGHISVIPAD